MRFFIFILLFSFLLAPLTGYCQAPVSIILEHEGVQGYWFPESIGDKLLKDVTELKLVKQKITFTNVQLDQKDYLINLLVQDIDASEKIADKWKQAFTDQVEVTHVQQKYYETQLESSKKWYKSPVLWFSVGFVAATAMAIGLNYGLSETRN